MLDRFFISSRVALPAAVVAASLSVLSSSGHAALIGDEGMTLLWHLDDTRVDGTLIADDATTNNHNGAATSNIVAGGEGIAGTSFSGFNSSLLQVRHDFVPDNNSTSYFANRDFSFITWVKNPAANNAVNLIARADRNTANSDNAWQLWIDGTTGEVKFSVRDWGGAMAYFTSDTALTWDPDKWYQIAFTFDHTAANIETVNVYVIAQDETEATKVLTGVHNKALSRSDTLVIGGGGNGYNGSTPAGAFGGSIDEVSLWMNRLLTPQEIESHFAATVPEPAAVGAVALLGLGLLRRSRTSK